MKKNTEKEKKVKNTKGKIKILKDGPYLVSGAIPLAKEKVVADKNGILRWSPKIGQCDKL